MTQKELFEQSGLSQTEIAALFNVKQPRVSAMANGHRLMTTDQYKKLTGKVAGSEYLEIKRNYEMNDLSRDMIDHDSKRLVYYFRRIKRVIAFDTQKKVIFESVCTSKIDAITKWDEFKNRMK